MEGKHFDQVVKRMAAGVGRRHVLGGLIGTTAAVLTGAAAIKAKPGGGGGPGKTKKTVCHYQGTKNGTPKYKALKLGGPGADNHVAKHENDGYFGDCCPGDTCTPQGQCFTAACTKDATTSTFSCVSTPTTGSCTLASGATGVCSATGQCCIDPTDPTTCDLA